MGNTVFLLSVALVSLVFTSLGIYAWRREKPMWFWSGSVVDEEEIKDIPAYNRANGLMWIVFSIPLWTSVVVGNWNGKIATYITTLTLVAGFPLLILTYKKIYNKYKNQT